MTKTLRTFEQIETDIAFIAGGIDKIEAAIEAQRAELGQDDRAYVVGFPCGLFIDGEGHMVAAHRAKLFGSHIAASIATSRIFNARGERAIAMSYDGAIDLSLRLNADALKVLNDCLHGLYEERNEWEDAERAADEGEYYDSFDYATAYEERHNGV